MQHKDLSEMRCPIARSLERVGEWWSILILRDAFLGATRFEQFQKNLDIAPNTLTRRLNALVEAGLLERHRYCDRPPRDEYRLTAAGRDFRPVLWALLALAMLMPWVLGLADSEIGVRKQRFRGRGWAIFALVGMVALWCWRYAEQLQARALIENIQVTTAPISRMALQPYPVNPYRWHVIDGVGHFPHEERPDAFDTELRGWLADPEPER